MGSSGQTAAPLANVGFIQRLSHTRRGGRRAPLVSTTPASPRGCPGAGASCG